MKTEITSWQQLENVVERVGMLPYFNNNINGFSVEDIVPENILWDIDNGPWEWKGQITRNLRVAYGKFFRRRAGYVSLDVLPHLMNVRRSIFTLDEEHQRLLKILMENDSLLSKEFKSLAGYIGGRRKKAVANPFKDMPEIDVQSNNKKTGSKFESAITQLQMSTNVVIADFEYLYDRHGDRYGWGIARYTTPEALYGIKKADCSEEESVEYIYSKLSGAFSEVDAYMLISAIYK